MRDKVVIYGKIAECRKLQLQARKDGLAALVNHYQREIDKLQSDLQAVNRFGGKVLPMRTVWKRLAGPRYFEEL